MSAFIVSRAHICYLVTAALHRDFRCIEDYDQADALGQMLWDENVKSVQARYASCSIEQLPGVAEDEPLAYGTHTNSTRPIEPAQLLKACDCYDYQSCEHPGYDQSQAKELIEELRAMAWHKVPGYDAAQWEITEAP